MAALIRAETWLGASGWARGSQTCMGTMPAFVANPRMSATKATVAAVGLHGVRRKALNWVLPASAARMAKPISTRKKLSWVMAAYQSAAERTAEPRTCSVSTRTVEVSAISSQASRNETTSALAATSCMAVRKTASAIHDVREADGPWT